jgi:oligo-alginate lyase
MKSAARFFLLLAIPITSAYAAKTGSVFYAPQVMQKIRNTAAADEWGKSVREQTVKTAAVWLAMSDDSLWQHMFASTITRSWMVWSNGFCPSCKKSVAMYSWKINGLEKPWKVQCPNCNEYFPKNDFYAFYRSGLDEHAAFDPKKADRSLLINHEHPELNDSLHLYGVDDGEGYVEGENRWRFIGAYLIYGQWKQRIMMGVRNLAAAYVLTGDPAYAHKAAIMLDRLADLFPDFDFSTQGLSYERKDPIIGQGYVTVWHDGCEELRELALAYDMIYDAMAQDQDLLKFLGKKARQFSPANPKTTVMDIRDNIETRLFRDALRNRYKIESNFPRTDATIAILETVLGWPEKKQAVLEIVDRFISKSTQADGLSGEKGFSGYASGAPRCLAQFLSLYSRMETGFLRDLLARHPALIKTFRVYADAWFMEQYYPNIGDTGIFGKKTERYAAANFLKSPGPAEMASYAFTSSFTLFWQLYEITQDPVFVQILYKENEYKSAGLPFDLFCTNPQAFQNNVDRVIKQYGSQLEAKTFNLQEWCLAMFHSGQGENRRALWIDYDVGGNHCHADAMNVGLLAKGLDLLPPFGYPPVQFGGWVSPKALWYRKTASHNTVVVDGQDQMPGIGQRETEPLAEQLNPLKRHQAGKTTCWMPGKNVQGIRVSGAALYRGLQLQQYERTVALVDISENDSYVLDVFRVIGGSDHVKLTHGYFGELVTEGLHLKPVDDLGFDAQISELRSDDRPVSGWKAMWKVRDDYHYLPADAEIQLHYFDATTDAMAGVAKTWMAFGFNSDQTAEIPCLLVRRKSALPGLASCFADVIEPSEKQSRINAVQRLEVCSMDQTAYSDMNVALVVHLQNGEQDRILAMDVENPLRQTPSFVTSRVAVVPQWRLVTDAEFCLLRTDQTGQIKKLALAHGTYVKVGDFEMHANAGSAFLEMDLLHGALSVVAGEAETVKSAVYQAKRLSIK